MKKELFDAKIVAQIAPLETTPVWASGAEGEVQRAGLEAFLQEFVDAGSLVTAMYPNSKKDPYFDLRGKHKYGHIDVNELLSDTQVLIVKEMQRRAPKLYEALRDLGDGKIAGHAVRFDNMPTGDIAGIPTPTSIYLNQNQRKGVMADYFTAGISLIAGGVVGMPRQMRFFDVVDKSRSGGRLPHTDPPEQFFVLQCQRGEADGKKVVTLLHDMETAFRRLRPKDQEILQEKRFVDKEAQRLFAPVRTSTDGGFSMSVTRNVNYLTKPLPSDEKAAEAGEAFKNWMEEGLKLRNIRAVSLEPGQVVVDSRYLMHSVARLKGEEVETPPSQQIGERWLVRAGIYSEPVYPDLGAGSFYRLPQDIDKAQTLENISMITRALESNRTPGK